MNGYFCGTSAEMKKVSFHGLIKALENLPEPNYDVLIGHVSFVSSIFLPVFNINMLFPTDNHFQFVGLKYFQVLVRNDLIQRSF